jgi:hypothetical protein
MTLEQIRCLLGWCSLINFILLWVSFVLLVLLRGWVYKIHSKFFPITEAQFNIAAYIFLGVYKLLVFVFNIIPWIALCIVT